MRLRYDRVYSGRVYIDDVLALVPLPVVWAGAAGQMTDVHMVDVACGAGHLDGFLGHIIGATVGAVDYEHPTKGGS